ncbi:endonuclease domain-containing protein [Streptomyces boninensis]|uniref:endonuclease domain-containing protein n=1 Tax=Streptomyces boninensis TaxID=2039455 RepID=UPI003B225241
MSRLWSYEHGPACHDWQPPEPQPQLPRRTTSALAAIRDWQRGRCAICGAGAPASGRAGAGPEATARARPGAGAGAGALVIDHHHPSGLVRGLLCGGCNTAEGRSTGYYDEPYGAYRQRPPALIVGLTERYPSWRPNAYYYVLGDPPDDPALAARVLEHLIRHPPRRPGRPVEIPGLPGEYVVGSGMRDIAARLEGG